MTSRWVRVALMPAGGAMSIPGIPSVPLHPLTSRDPTQLGEFRLLGRLGSGGMGTAFLAQGLSGWVVVKEAHVWVGADPNLRARMAREVATMRRVAGPRTAAVLDADLDAEIPWVAMEFVPGETLYRAVEVNGPLTAAGVQQLATELAEALRQLHSAGVTHRDLKPANIMMSPTGARLLDLGVAEVNEGTQLTRTGSVIGSPGWLAPEQVRGDPVSAATDVHAWALCVLFGATGDAPFGRDTSAAAVYRVLETAPQVPATIREPLHGLLARALAKDPAHRPTVDQIVAAFTRPRDPGSAPTPTQALAELLVGVRVASSPHAEFALSPGEVQELTDEIAATGAPIFIAVLPASAGVSDEILIELRDAVGLSGTYAVVVGGEFRAASDDGGAADAATAAFRAHQTDGITAVLSGFIRLRAADVATHER